jgi:hypothetical protein
MNLYKDLNYFQTFKSPPNPHFLILLAGTKPLIVQSQMGPILGLLFITYPNGQSESATNRDKASSMSKTVVSFQLFHTIAY